MGYVAGDRVRQQFTAKERDAETGLDYFLARYYAPLQGRFTSPDEFNGGPVEFFAATASSNPTFYADLTNPQTLNKYQYCLNNPLRYIDPYGHQQQETWYDRLMKFLGLLWKASGSGDGGMNYESSEQSKGGNGPLDIRPEKLAMNSWLQTGKGLEVLADVEMTLFDPTGAVSAAHDLQTENYANLGISLAFRAGTPVLSKFFGVTTSKLLSGSLLDATVGGSTITAQFRKAGNTLSADIVYIANKSPSGLNGVTRQLYKNIFELAKQQGAENVTVNAVAVTNKKLEEKLLSNGWQKTKVTVEGFGKVDAYTKTFKVPN